MDTLRAKLSEKHKDMEAVKKQVSSLKEMLSRYMHMYMYIVHAISVTIKCHVHVHHEGFSTH